LLAERDILLREVGVVNLVISGLKGLGIFVFQGEYWRFLESIIFEKSGFFGKFFFGALGWNAVFRLGMRFLGVAVGHLV